MTPSTRKTNVAADPAIPAVHITRDFEAPPDLVCRAHTDAELYARWIGPHRLTTHIERWDASTGGAYRFVQFGTDGKRHRFFGSFHEVRPGERIVQTFCYEGFPDAVALETLTFEDLGGGRTRLHSTSITGSFESRDAMLASGMEQGIQEGYDKLDDLLLQR